MRLPFSSGMVAIQSKVAGSAALPLLCTSMPPCRAHGSVAALAGQHSAQLSSRWQPWGGRRAFAVPPPQPQHVRRWRGIAAMAKGGKQQKRKQDDSAWLSPCSSCWIRPSSCLGCCSKIQSLSVVSPQCLA